MSTSVTPPDLELLRQAPRDSLLPADDPARFVDSFVDALDLDALGFIHARRPNFRDPHSASKLLKLFLFAWYLGIVSMRALARACRWDLRLLYLSHYDPPKRSSIGRFWRANHHVLFRVFETLVRYAAEAGLVGMDLHAVDGTKLRAVSSMHTGLHREGLKRKLTALEAQLTKLEEGRSSRSAREQIFLFERTTEERKQVLERIALLERHGVSHLHPCEPDVPVMRVDPRPLFAYNAQAVVDHEHDLIVAVGMSTDENDLGQLVPMVEETQRMLGAPAKQTVADKGYASGPQLDQAERRHLPVLVDAQAESDKGLLPKSSFAYDKERDEYVCPTGERLLLEDTRKMSHDAQYETAIYRCHNKSCPERSACSSDRKGRTVKRTPFDDAWEHQRTLLAQPEMRNLYELRKEIIEHHYGNIKSNYGFRRFTVRGLAKAFAQFVLACIASNLRKLWQIWAVGLFQWHHGLAHE
jgi:transposase